MFSLIVSIIFVETILFRTGELTPCSELELTQIYTNSDPIYSIVTEPIRSSDLIQVKLLIKQSIPDTSWFVMGASDTKKFVGSWQPLTSTDGQVVDCSLSADAEREEIVSNSNLMKSSSIFYWMPSQNSNGVVIFRAKISVKDISTGLSSLRYIESFPINIDLSQEPQRYQDVNISS